MDYLTFLVAHLSPAMFSAADPPITLHTLWLAYRPGTIALQGVCLCVMVTWVTWTAGSAAWELVPQQ